MFFYFSVRPKYYIRIKTILSFRATILEQTRYQEYAPRGSIEVHDWDLLRAIADERQGIH
jgi:hypothetical protein